MGLASFVVSRVGIMIFSKYEKLGILRIISSNIRRSGLPQNHLEEAEAASLINHSSI